MSEEIRSKNLQRYYDNKEVYNEKAKQYFRAVWYIKNRDSILKKQKEYRDRRRKPSTKRKVVASTQIINPSLIVSFE